MEELDWFPIESTELNYDYFTVQLLIALFDDDTSYGYIGPAAALKLDTVASRSTF